MKNGRPPSCYNLEVLTINWELILPGLRFFPGVVKKSTRIHSNLLQNLYTGGPLFRTPWDQKKLHVLIIEVSSLQGLKVYHGILYVYSET